MTTLASLNSFSSSNVVYQVDTQYVSGVEGQSELLNNLSFATVSTMGNILISTGIGVQYVVSTVSGNIAAEISFDSANLASNLVITLDSANGIYSVSNVHSVQDYLNSVATLNPVEDFSGNVSILASYTCANSAGYTYSVPYLVLFNNTPEVNTVTPDPIRFAPGTGKLLTGNQVVQITDTENTNPTTIYNIQIDTTQNLSILNITTAAGTAVTETSSNQGSGARYTLSGVKANVNAHLNAMTFNTAANITPAYGNINYTVTKPGTSAFTNFNQSYANFYSPQLTRPVQNSNWGPIHLTTVFATNPPGAQALGRTIISLPEITAQDTINTAVGSLSVVGTSAEGFGNANVTVAWTQSGVDAVLAWPKPGSDNFGNTLGVFRPASVNLQANTVYGNTTQVTAAAYTALQYGWEQDDLVSVTTPVVNSFSAGGLNYINARFTIEHETSTVPILNRMRMNFKRVEFSPSIYWTDTAGFVGNWSGKYCAIGVHFSTNPFASTFEPFLYNFDVANGVAFETVSDTRVGSGDRSLGAGRFRSPIWIEQSGADGFYNPNNTIPFPVYNTSSVPYTDSYNQVAWRSQLGQYRPRPWVDTNFGTAKNLYVCIGGRRETFNFTGPYTVTMEFIKDLPDVVDRSTSVWEPGPGQYLRAPNIITVSATLPYPSLP